MRSRSLGAVARRFVDVRAAAALLLLVAGRATAQQYEYPVVPPVLYVVGKPEFGSPADGTRRVTLYKDIGQAMAAAAGQPVYRILRHALDRTSEGTAFLKSVQAARNEDGPFQINLTSEQSLIETLHKNSRVPGDLGPVNPNWKLTGRFKDLVKDMNPDYKPEGAKDDYKNGRFYFPTEGSEAAVNFMQNFKVHVGKDASGNTILMRRNDAGTLMPIDTRDISSDAPPGQCIFVMDADGNMYVLAREWVIGIKAMGFDGVNHSSIPAGHPIAAAGKLTIHNGKVVAMDNSSGHYHPSNAHLKQAISQLQTLGIEKGSYDVGFLADDHPGHAYLELDSKKEQRKFVDAPLDDSRTGGPLHGDPNARRPDGPADAASALKPEETIPDKQLDVDRRAAEPPPASGTMEADKPVEPPPRALVEDIRKQLAALKPEQIDAAVVKRLYALDPKAAKAIAEAVSKGGLDAHNMKIGQVRKQLDLEVWKKILSEHNIQVETTNQGKNNGARSDLDYTLYFVAEEAGVTIKDLIAEHTATWKALHQLDPAQVEIKVMNGDEFYPDWRNEALGSVEHELLVKDVLGQLRGDAEKYSVPGGNKEQVHNRPLSEGRTEKLRYDPELDKPDVPIERQVISDAGPTREISRRYQGVHAQYNTMNALGNLIQNKAEFFSHTGDQAQDATRRAKYFNRVINLGLGNLRFFPNTYGQIHAGQAAKKEQMKEDFLMRAFGTLARDEGRPAINSSQLRHYKEVIDISMRIEAEKTANANYMDQRESYFRDKYARNAEAFVDLRLGNSPVTPEERKALVLDEMQRLFEHDQKLLLAEAILAGMRQSVARDLTPEGVLRNRLRFDEKTQKFIADPEGAKKVAFERATEVALFFELVNLLPDGTPFEKAFKESLKARAMATAPNKDIETFYEALDKVNAAEIDKFIKGDPESHVQKSMDELRAKRDRAVLELLADRKEKAVEFARQKGVRADPSTVAPADVHAHILEAQSERLAPSRRTQIRAVAGALGTRIGGEFREAFTQNGSALMMGSSAVNLARAWQSGAPGALGYAAFTEAINYMPDAIQTPFTVVDLLAKVKRGEYVGAAWSGSLFAAMSQAPVLGHAMLAYNITTGTLDIAHTHFVTRIDQDLTEQALKSRPRNEQGGGLPDGVRARPNRFPDAKESVYNGSGPGFPLFFGRYVKEHGPNTSPEYLDGTVPHDALSDDQLADSASFEFAPQIDSILRAANLTPGTQAWAGRAWDLKRKYGFDIPFYRRMTKVYQEKYRFLTYFENWPSPYNKEYLEECRMDVYDWFVQQPPGYKLELAGDATFWFGDQTDKMQEMIARQCALILGSIHEITEHADEVDKSNLKAFKEAMKRGFDAERSLLAAKRALHARIQADEQKAAAEVEKRALELATRHKTQLVISYPFTYATEEDLSLLDVDVRTLAVTVKQPTSVDLKQELGTATEGAPPGWEPGPSWADAFKPDKDGFVARRPITVPMKITGNLLDADKKQVATASLTLPVVVYAPTFSGTVTVKVYGMTAKGDSTDYPGALVTLGSETQATDALNGVATFVRLKPGAHSVKVAPSKGDERHGPGSGSASLVDLLLTKDPNGTESARIVVKLPYIPEKVVADSTTNPGTKNPTGGTGTGAKNPADSAAKKAAADSAAEAAVETAVAKLGPLTARAEATRDQAIAACRYGDAAAAQEQLVAAAKSFIASAFPQGAPAGITSMAQEYDTKLVELKKFALGETEARVHLRRGLAFIQQKKGEPALTALEEAEKVDNVPKCLHDQIVQTYNELKADIEKRILIIDKAVDAANNKCDYPAARAFGEQVEKEDASLSWVVNELPRIKDLEKKQQDARALAQQAEQKAALAEQAAGAGNAAQAEALFNEAITLANQALQLAPACDKQNYSDGVTALVARKTALTNPTVDQSVVLLLDTSGSMGSGGKMESAKQAATDAVRALGPTVEVALLTYDGGCAGGYRVVAGFTTQKAGIVTAIAGLSPGGGTPTAPAIGFAHDYMKKSARGKSAQIVLMTDGQNDCGSMVDAGSGLRNSNIPVRLDAVGFGLDPSSQATKDLGDIVRASGGGGGAYSANSSAELISAFRRAFITTQVKPRDPMVSGAAGTRLADLFAAAIAALKANDMRGAVGQFKSAVDQFPASPAAQFNASLAYEAAGQPLAALNHAQQYLKLAPNAFDAGSVRERVTQLEAEQAANPRAIYTPNDCSALYRWAQREVRAAGGEAARRAAVYAIMTTAQRGECPAAEKAYEDYVTKYVKKP